MKPVPYRSPWAGLTHYLFRWAVGGRVFTVVAADGVQPAGGLMFGDGWEAAAWLRDNGFVKVPNPGDDHGVLEASLA